MAGVLASIFAIASYAQAQNNVYYAGTSRKYGRVYAYNGSHFEIYTSLNTVIKTFANSCTPTSSGGVAGVKCTFGEFRNSNGEHFMSGYGLFFRNGLVYLIWTNEKLSGNVWRNINTGWHTFVPGA